MPCTNETPCQQPVLRWVHSERCQLLTRTRREGPACSREQAIDPARVPLDTGRQVPQIDENSGAGGGQHRIRAQFVDGPEGSVHHKQFNFTRIWRQYAVTRLKKRGLWP